MNSDPPAEGTPLDGSGDGGGEKISKNELKRRQKAEEKAKKQADKAVAAASAAAAAAAAGSTDGAGKEIDELAGDIDPSKYFEIRSRMVKEMPGQGFDPYPHKFHVSTSLQEFITKYSSVPDGRGWRISIAGRVFSVREQRQARLLRRPRRGGQDSGHGRRARGQDDFHAVHSKLRVATRLPRLPRPTAASCRCSASARRCWHPACTSCHLHFGLKDQETGIASGTLTSS